MTLIAHDIGPVADYVSGRPVRVVLGGRAMVVVRDGDSFYALRDVCVHQGAKLSQGKVGGTAANCGVGDSVSYVRCGQILQCPWHGWEYDMVTGCSLVNPDQTRVKVYPVRIESGRVLVEA